MRSDGLFGEGAELITQERKEVETHDGLERVLVNNVSIRSSEVRHEDDRGGS